MAPSAKVNQTVIFLQVSEHQSNKLISADSGRPLPTACWSPALKELFPQPPLSYVAANGEQQSILTAISST